MITTKQEVYKYCGIELDLSRDNLLTEQGLRYLTTEGFYKKPNETTPQETFARAAACYSFGDSEFAKRIYDYASKQWFAFASPVLSNAVAFEWPVFTKEQFRDAGQWLKNNVKPSGMPISCFAAKTPVYTIHGVKNIEDIVVGDKVLTHKGRFRKVEAVKESQSSDIYELRCAINRTTLLVTGNHLLLTNSGWKRVDEIEEGVDLVAQTYLVDKENETEGDIYLELECGHKEYLNKGTFRAKDIPTKVIVDKDLAWALGFWFAEGPTSDVGTVKVTHGTPEPCEKWCSIVAKAFGLNYLTRANKTWFDGEINSVFLSRGFDSLFGKGCKTKKLPDVWMETTWKKDIFEAFLEGFYLGDGFKTTKKKAFELANPLLVSQIALLLKENGYNVNSQYRKQVKYNKDKGNDVYNAIVYYDDKSTPVRTGVGRGIVFHDGLKYAGILSLKKVDVGEINVYDIQVEEDESFSAAGVIAHNCFLNNIHDSKEGLTANSAETKELSMAGGGVGVFMGNRSPDTKSTGVMAHAREYDAVALAYKQAESRRGSIALYLDIDHPEVMSFLGMRDPTGGDSNKKCFNLNHGLNITDKFMRAVIKGEKYPLVDPKHGNTGQSLDAREVWEKILETRKETGEPYLLFIDTVNKNLPKWVTKPTYKVTQSNLCS